MIIMLWVLRIFIILMSIYLFLLISTLAVYKDDPFDRAFVVIGAGFSIIGLVLGSILIGIW